MDKNDPLMVKAEAEFEAELDTYMAQWEETLRAKVSPPKPKKPEPGNDKGKGLN